MGALARPRMECLLELLLRTRVSKKKGTDPTSAAPSQQPAFADIGGLESYDPKQQRSSLPGSTKKLRLTGGTVISVSPVPMVVQRTA